MAVTSMLRVRMSAKDAHYGGNLVDGAHMVHLFGDVATELLIKQDGDEGLFCAYDMVEFKAPVYAGDYIEAYGEITHVGNTSRKMKFEAYKVIRTLPRWKYLPQDEIRGLQGHPHPARNQRQRCRGARGAHPRLPCHRHLRHSQRVPALQQVKDCL